MYYPIKLAILVVMCFIGLKLMGVVTLAALIISVIPAVLGALAILTGWVFGVSGLIFAAGILWAVAPMVVGQDKVDQAKEVTQTEATKILKSVR